MVKHQGARDTEEMSHNTVRKHEEDPSWDVLDLESLCWQERKLEIPEAYVDPCFLCCYHKSWRERIRGRPLGDCLSAKVPGLSGHVLISSVSKGVTQRIEETGSQVNTLLVSPKHW